MFKLDILSDPICPWCYIGKTYLDTALAQAPQTPIVIEWHPFQLNPDMPLKGMARSAYLEQKFGGRERAIQVYSRIEATAAQAGLAIDWSKIKRTPNTLDAHRLLHWAGLESKQNDCADALFAAYFEHGRDIGDPETLIAIAQDIGMQANMVRRLLDGNADKDDIRARDQEARARGVTGVPCFVLGEAHMLAGAQPVEVWQNIFDQLHNKNDQ